MLASVHTFLQDHALVVSAAQTAEDILQCRYGAHREDMVGQSPRCARYMSQEGPYLALEIGVAAGRFWQQYFRNFNTPKDHTFLDHVDRVHWRLYGYPDAAIWRAANIIYL